MFVSNFPNLTLNSRTESLSSQSEIWLCHSPTCNPALAPYNLRIKSKFLSIMYRILPTNLTYHISSPFFTISHPCSPITAIQISAPKLGQGLLSSSLCTLFPSTRILCPANSYPIFRPSWIITSSRKLCVNPQVWNKYPHAQVLP